ncbi:MAG: elongation factor P [Anaerolineae bacterium]|nr:elongation factor P [Thermoflexales bacterium]MDW8394632.1 elongation factor P [Anaerolineae bacterium]
MIDVNELRKGTAFELDGDLFLVLEYWHNKPGRGNATVRVKVRNLRTGAIVDKTFVSGDRVQDIEVQTSNAQFLYKEDNLYHFMDMTTYEQFALDEGMLQDALPYLKENLEVRLRSHDGEPLGIELPPSVDLVVTDAPIGIAGDTAAGGGTKVVTVETGLKVTTPLFINTGDVIRVDTRTGAYVTRAG